MTLRWDRLAICVWILAIVCVGPWARAGDRSQARSMVISRYGIVATSHVQASVAGAQVLARGGSAIDAAIAANATLGVTEPMMNGMGGDLFAIYWDAKSGKLWAQLQRVGAAGIDPGIFAFERNHVHAERGDQHRD